MMTLAEVFMASMRRSTRRATKAAAERGERGEENERDRQRADHHAADSRAVAKVVADEEAEAAGQRIDMGERAPAGPRPVGGLVGGVDEAGPVEHAGGKLRDIAGQRLAGGVGQEIKRGAGLAGARVDDGAEAADAALIVLLRQARGLRLDRLRHLVVDDRDHLPGDGAEDDPGAHRAQQQYRHRETEGGGADDLSERRHGSYIRRRAPCAGGERRSRGRSSP